MKPFYCKPATFEEAFEIYERAIANGATDQEKPVEGGGDDCFTFLWNCYCYWGVKSCYGTFTENKGRFFGDDAESLTMQQVRELYPHPKYDNKEDKTIYVTENKQDFVPDVGRECEGDIDGIWVKVKPLYEFKLGDWAVRVTDGQLKYCEKFRPLKTEAEIRREKVVEEMMKDCPYPRSDSTRIDCEALYDKGYIKPRDITDDDIIRTIGITSNYDHEYFTSAVRWAEKHIKGEA